MLSFSLISLLSVSRAERRFEIIQLLLELFLNLLVIFADDALVDFFGFNLLVKFAVGGRILVKGQQFILIFAQSGKNTFNFVQAFFNHFVVTDIDAGNS